MSEAGKVRVGMIATGGMARFHMNQMAGVPELQIVALCDPNPDAIERARAISPATANLPAFASHQEMLRAVEMDAVEVATPHTLHFEHVVAGLEAGLHVLCEKPLVCSVADAKALIEKRDATGKVCLLSYQRHYQPEFRYIRQQIQSGAFGKVTFVNALQCQQWKKGTAGTWRQDPALSGGGQLNDSGSHLLDIILWVTGLGVDKVSAHIDNCGTPVDINSALALTFKGGAQATISVVGDAPCWHEDLTIWCENGVFFMRNGKLSVCDGDGNRYAFEHLTGGSNPDRNFADAILGRAEVQSPFECGLRVIELTEAAWKSAANGSAVVHV